MKKTLLLLMVAGICGTSQAQNQVAAKSNHITISLLQQAQMRLKAKQLAEKQGTLKPSEKSSRRPHGVGTEPTLPFLGSSANVNGVRDATTTAVTANQACNLLVMTHRENQADVGTCGTGAFVAAYSTNGGTVWDSEVYISCNQPSRYPNGAIFNGAGNTDPMNATVAMSGPWTNSATSGDSWVESVFGSITVGNTNSHESFWINGNPGVSTENTGDLSFMSSSDDSTVHVIGQGYSITTAGGYGTWLGAVLTTGKFNAAADSFQWSQQVFQPHLVPEVLGYATMNLPYDTLVAPLADPGTAWSQDGKTGYVVIFGNLDSTGYNYFAAQPIVYKTTDAGVTWAMMPPYNFANLTSLTTYLYPSSDNGIKTPLWYTFEFGNYSQGANDEYDLTVDAYGNLHIIGAIISSYYSNVDSSYTISAFVGQHGYIYDVSTMSGGGWQARYIDSMNTYPSKVTLNTDWSSTGTAGSYVGFGNRLQTSRSTDGKYIFTTWQDDLSGNVPDSLVYPEVYGQSYNVYSGISSSTKQFTHTGGSIYFLCVSDIAVSNGSPDTTFTVPCTIVFPQVSPGGQSDGSGPINYFYLDSVMYNEMPLSVPSLSSLGFGISQNYPNPFNNITQFNISLAKESMVSVDVFNMFGQKVYSINSQRMESGNHLMTIDGSGWNTGVYFYRVTVNNQSVTKKMVIE